MIAALIARHGLGRIACIALRLSLLVAVVLLLLLSLRRSGERLGRVLERLEASEKSMTFSGRCWRLRLVGLAIATSFPAGCGTDGSDRRSWQPARPSLATAPSSRHVPLPKCRRFRRLGYRDAAQRLCRDARPVSGVRDDLIPPEQRESGAGRVPLDARRGCQVHKCLRHPFKSDIEAMPRSLRYAIIHRNDRAASLSDRR